MVEYHVSIMVLAMVDLLINWYICFYPPLYFLFNSLQRTCSHISWYPIIGLSGSMFKTVVTKVLIFSYLSTCSTSCSVGEVTRDAPVQGLGLPCSDGFVGLYQGVVKYQLPY